jgi:N-acetylmuramoyl-L-alanine amidase
MPGALIETGFLSTDLDEQYLMKKENQQEMATCIFLAFQQYKKDVEDPDQQQVPVAVNTTAARTDTVAVQHKGGQVSESANGTVYRIQLAASSKSTIDSRYQSLDDLEVIREGELYKFLVGSYATQDAARPRLAALKSKGFDGAFIVAYHQGKRVRA